MVTGHRTENSFADVLVNFVRSWLKIILRYKDFPIVFFCYFRFLLFSINSSFESGPDIRKCSLRNAILHSAQI